VRRHRGKVVERGACCEVCGEVDPLVLAPERVEDRSVVLCRNDAARMRQRVGVTVDELRLEHVARSRGAAA
jgi:hypothetical protein